MPTPILDQAYNEWSEDPGPQMSFSPKGIFSEGWNAALQLCILTPDRIAQADLESRSDYIDEDTPPA